MNTTTLYVVPEASEIFGRMELAVRRMRQVADRSAARNASVRRAATDDGAPMADWPTLAVVAALSMLFAGLAF